MAKIDHKVRIRVGWRLTWNVFSRFRDGHLPHLPWAGTPTHGCRSAKKPANPHISLLQALYYPRTAMRSMQIILLTSTYMIHNHTGACVLARPSGAARRACAAACRLLPFDSIRVDVRVPSGGRSEHSPQPLGRLPEITWLPTAREPGDVQRACVRRAWVLATRR